MYDEDDQETPGSGGQPAGGTTATISPQRLEAQGRLQRALQDLVGLAEANGGSLPLRPAVVPESPRPRGRRALPLNAETLLARVREDRGAQAVDDEALVFLLAAPQRGAVREFAREIFTGSDLWERHQVTRALALGSDALLLLAIQTLQQEQLVELLMAIAALLDDFRTRAALQTLHSARAARLRGPLGERRERLLRQLEDEDKRALRQAMADQWSTMARTHMPAVRRRMIGLFGANQRHPGPARYFEHHYDWIVIEVLDGLNALRMDLRRLAADSAAISNPPSAEELRQDERHAELVAAVPRIEETLRETRQENRQLSNEYVRLARQRPRTDEIREAMDQVGGDRDDARADLPVLRGRLRDARQERNALARSLRRVRPRIDAYRAAVARGVQSAELTDRRDEHLRLADRAVGRAAPLSLLEIEDGDEARWLLYELLVREMSEARGAGSIEFVMAAVMLGYEPVTRWIDPGIHIIHTMGTYPDHGHTDDAVDMATTVSMPLRVIAPERLVLPPRLALSDSATVYTYDHSVVGPNVHGATSELQDVFSKLAYGMLRFRNRAAAMEWGGEPPTRSGEDSSGRGSLRSSAVEQFMAVHGIDLELPEDFGSVPSADRPEGSTASPADALAARGLAPGALRDATVFDPDPRRVLAGLAYANLTLTHNLPEDIDEERISILRQIEREVRRRLRLAPSEAVFRTGSVDTSRGTVGMGRLIAYPRAAVITRTVREILIEDGADFNPDGTTHRIWRLLWALRFAGAMPHRRGQATRVWHTYVAGDERILIDVYYSHLRDVRGAASRPGAPVALGAVLATVGTTGNSVSTHLHLEIKVKLRDRPAQPREIGALLPHEFFPLATDFRRPAPR